MYTEEYRPQKLSEISGQPKALKELVAWFNTWPEQKKAAVLYGRAGIGKTSAILALANEFNADVVELNASDQRNKDVIERIVGNAATSSTLDGSRKIIVLDEADNIYGKADYGGNQALSKIISETRNPIILIANAYWEIPQGIRRKAKMIEFRTLLPASIKKVLKRVAQKEELNVSESTLQKISKNANGDLRAALNDLESLTGDEYYNPRDTEVSIFNGLSSVFREHSVTVREKFWSIDQQPRESLLWIAENMPLVYETGDCARGYYYLSRADIFLGRAFRRQYYKLWGYAMDLMTSGVSVARQGKYHFQRFRSPSYFTALAKSRKDRNMRSSIYSKIAEECHCSTSEAKEYVIMMQALESDPVRAASLCRFFELDDDEIAYIFKKENKILKAFEKLDKIKKEKRKKELKERKDTQKLENFDKKVEKRKKKSLKQPEKKDKKESKQKYSEQKSLLDYS
ncbi:MAG: replication factor C large subunit [Candidatus Methanofastidiosia archaeon]|jgi:replication factor C large subunit